jgi:hypothetical protein
MNVLKKKQKNPCKLSQREGGGKVERVSNILNLKKESITNWLARNRTDKRVL